MIPFSFSTLNPIFRVSPPFRPFSTLSRVSAYFALFDPREKRALHDMSSARHQCQQHTDADTTPTSALHQRRHRTNGGATPTSALYRCRHGTSVSPASATPTPTPERRRKAALTSTKEKGASAEREQAQKGSKRVGHANCVWGALQSLLQE